MTPTRRDILKAGAGAAVMGSLAGCVDGLFEGTDADGYAAFLSLWDWAENVAGDEMTFENPIDVGQMGHGWDPDGDLTPNVVDAGLFIYLDTPEFEWARNLVQTLENDHPDEVTVVNLLSGLESEFLPFDGGGDMPEPEPGHTAPEDELDLDFELWDSQTGEQLGWWHSVPGDEHWHGGHMSVGVDGVQSVVVLLSDRDGNPVDMGDEATYHVDARIADGEPDDILEIESEGDRIILRGRERGQTGLVFELYKDGELFYETPQDAAPVEVGDEAVMNFDPHTWVDPILAQKMVDNIADALGELDPDNAQLYQDNAESYNEQLQGVHNQFEAVIADAQLDTAIFAGHDSYQYVENRYGFDLVTPVGVAPDEDVSSADISNLVAIIEEHGIDTVLYDPFETPRPGEDEPELVRVLRDETHITEARMLTPAEGVTPEWDENGWGWVEQMEEVNLPSLERALNPE